MKNVSGTVPISEETNEADNEDMPVSFEPSSFSSKFNFEQQQSSDKSESNDDDFKILYPLFSSGDKCKIVPL